MSLFKGGEIRSFYGDPTYNPFERPAMPLASLALDGFLGGGNNNDSGEHVDPMRGAGIPTAYRCIAIISTVVASLTLELVKQNGDSNRWSVLDNLQSFTNFEIMEQIASRLAGWGNFYAKKVYAGNTLSDLVPYHNEDVDVLRINGVKTFRIRQRNDDGSTVVQNGQPVYVDYPDGPNCPVFHVPGLGFDGLKGQSPIILAARTFGTSIAADRLAARFYSRGQQLGGIISIKAPLSTQEQADAIRTNWRNAHAGISNSGDVAVLDAETSFQPITIQPEALQFLQSRQWQAWEIAKMFGIPVFMVSETTSYGGGIEQQNMGFVTYTIRSYTDRIEQRFTRDFAPRSQFFEFDLDRLMRGSMTERYQAYGTGIGWGFLTRAEVREKERMIALDPKYDLDVPLTPTAQSGAPAGQPFVAEDPNGDNPTNPNDGFTGGDDETAQPDSPPPPGS